MPFFTLKFQEVLWRKKTMKPSDPCQCSSSWCSRYKSRSWRWDASRNPNATFLSGSSFCAAGVNFFFWNLKQKRWNHGSQPQLCKHGPHSVTAVYGKNITSILRTYSQVLIYNLPKRLGPMSSQSTLTVLPVLFMGHSQSMSELVHDGADILGVCGQMRAFKIGTHIE